MIQEQSAKILIVDDEEDMLDSCQRLLTHMGYQCLTASTGRQGVEWVKQHHPDLVITDLKMPDMDGLEVLRECRLLDPNIVVLILTAFATVQNAVEAMKQGAADYLQKPFTAKQLRDAIERHLQQNRRSNAPAVIPPPSPRSHLMLGESEKIKHILSEIELIARTDANILITGESGTGKELAARQIYRSSLRSDKPFVPVDCACLSENLLESELFGHVKGAFTNAATHKTGLFEAAHQGTLFFDEISHLTLRAQAKLLRVVQERQFRPVGGKKLVDVNVRILSAANRNLEEDIMQNQFREDLYFRLNVISLHLPPLRERREDIPILLEHFIQKYSAPDRIIQIDPSALETFAIYEWPGNIRELENIVQRILATLEGSKIGRDNLPDFLLHRKSSAFSPRSEKLTEAVRTTERENILQALRKFHGERIKTAQYLGISRKSLWQKVKQYNIKSSEISDESLG